MPETKTCARCREAKPLDAFSYRADRADKRQAMCKACASAKVAEWRRQNREQTRIQNRRRSQRMKESTPAPFTRADVLAEWERLGIDPDRCFYCGSDDGSTIDHVWPITMDAGYNTPSNLRPCCRFCQTSKGASDPVEWIARTGLWPAAWGERLRGSSLILAQTMQELVNDPTLTPEEARVLLLDALSLVD
ncbi:HNH endonuclease [Streptomyces sp. NPDC007083]|uniref:HNH endonuclease n=1 Tax=unclassified Streptomyces TaxID=2593676 RepID=UPI0033DD8775